MSETSGLRDYVAWHDAYADPTSSLSIRLRYVQKAISDWYDTTTGDVTVLSVCAGQGDDILGVLQQRPELVARTRGALVEILPENVTIDRKRIADLGADLDVVEGDASTTDVYAGLVPADLVLLSGIMGNISAEDIKRLVDTAPEFCTENATVIWTRGAQEPDLGPSIHQWFQEAGFTQVDNMERLEGTRMRVGVNRLVCDPRPLQTGKHLFTFFR